MAYNVNSLTDDCYPNTLCLINKFDIRDEGQLSAIEADITFAKSSEWERNPLLESFDFNHYKAIFFNPIGIIIFLAMVCIHIDRT